MFEVGEWHGERIICLHDILKNDFGEVEEALFRGVERPYELILCILSTKKSELGEIACDNLPSERLKIRLW
jgi:hypothetical protein